MAASYLKNPTIERLPILLEQLHTGELQIPPFQRDFVWLTSQRLLLLDSVRKGIPSGSIFIWRTTRKLHTDSKFGPFVVSNEANNSPGVCTYLLDGQQRLITLFSTLGRALWTQDEEEVPLNPCIESQLTPDGKSWELYFNLRTEEFEVLNDEQKILLDGVDEHGCGHTEEDPPIYLPLNILFDDIGFDEWRNHHPGITRSIMRVARNLQSSFRDYMIPTVPLYTDDMEIVQHTFKRVNGGGTPMDEVHLARALTWSGDFDLTEQIENLRESLGAPNWLSLPDNWILKVIASLAGEEPFRADAEKVAQKIKAAMGGQGNYLMNQAKIGIQYAIDLHNDLGICSPGVVP